MHTIEFMYVTTTWILGPREHGEDDWWQLTSIRAWPSEAEIIESCDSPGAREVRIPLLANVQLSTEMAGGQALLIQHWHYMCVDAQKWQKLTKIRKIDNKNKEHSFPVDELKNSHPPNSTPKQSGYQKRRFKTGLPLYLTQVSKYSYICIGTNSKKLSIHQAGTLGNFFCRAGSLTIERTHLWRGESRRILTVARWTKLSTQLLSFLWRTQPAHRSVRPRCRSCMADQAALHWAAYSWCGSNSSEHAKHMGVLLIADLVTRSA